MDEARENPHAPVDDAEARRLDADFRYRTLVEHLPVVSYVETSFDPVSCPQYVSPQIELLLGYTAAEWLSTPSRYEQAIHADDREWVIEAKRGAYDSADPLRIEYRMVTRDGRVVWVEDRSMHVRPDHGPAFRQGFTLDISERKHAEDAVRQAETRYRTLVEQLPLALYIDRVDDESSNVFTSPQIELMLGYSAAQWISDPSLFVKTLHPDDREWVLAAHGATYATGEPLCLDYRLIARDGRIVWVHDEARMISDPAGGETVLQGYLLDVTARREAEELLRHQALHDPLTGLANRALFTNRVEQVVARGSVAERAAVLFLDLDDFKGVNDTYGQPTGDALLQAVAVRLQAALAPGNTVARIGGDEFAVLLEGGSVATAVDTAERLIADIQAPFELDGREVLTSTSAGVAVGDDAEALLRSADTAMYRAKAGGNAQYVVHTPGMDDDLACRVELVADLRRASVEEELTLHYQPIVDLVSGALIGVETLVRWFHPKHGLLPPAAFIPLAEETGRIVDIGRWVLDHACRQAARWRAELPEARSLAVGVNVSARQMERSTLIADVRGALAGSGLDASALVLEITESVLARRREEMKTILEEVTALGVRFALDDFGTGYSSLSLLQDIPVHVLKIDRAFVQSIDRGPRQVACARAIVGLAEALGLDVVAEGIESAAHVAALRDLGCRLGQGFYFAAPVESAELVAMIRSDGALRLQGSDREAA